MFLRIPVCRTQRNLDVTSRLRTASLGLVAAAGLLVAPLVFATAANAAVVSNVLFFSNEDYTDVTEEDATQIAGLEGQGATVTSFNGGDGSAAAWTAALADKQALVIPESDDIFDTAVLSIDAAAVIKAFVSGGGVLLLTTSYQAPLLSYITDVDYTSVWDTVGGEVWPLALDDAAFPAELGYSDGTYPVDISLWGEAQFNASFPVYYDDEANTGAVIGFPVGTGNVYTLAYDWYPGFDGDDEANRAVWNTVQGLLIPFIEVADPAVLPAAVPVLPETGVASDSPFWAVGAALLLMGAVAVTVTARRKATA